MKYFIYILFVTIATMILMFIGYIKDRNLMTQLMNILYRRCSSKVIKYLKHNDYASILDIQGIINGVNASVFWSRKRVSVTNPVQFANYIVDGLYKEGKIKMGYKGNSKIYYINKKAN